MNTKSMLLTKNQSLNAGGIYENAIAQELTSKGFKLYYYNSNRLANTEYQMEEGIVFANCNVSKKGKVTYLPIYMIMFLQKDKEQIILDKIEF